MNLTFAVFASQYIILCVWILFAPPAIWFPSPAPVPREGHGTQDTYFHQVY